MPEIKIKPSEFAPLLDSAEFQKGYMFRIRLPQSIDIERYNKKLTVRDHFLYCISNTSFPTSSTSFEQIAYFNSELKIAKKTTYNPWQMTFRYNINNNDFAVASNGSTNINCYQYFDYWRSAVYWEKGDAKAGSGQVYNVSSIPDIYKKTMDLVLLDENGNDSNQFTLEGAWPSSITGGNLGYTVDEIVTFNVDFTFDKYTHWISETEPGGTTDTVNG